MTIRWKLNLSIGALIAVFMAAAGFSIWAVSENAEETRTYSRMRELSQLTADLRTQVYQQIARAGGTLKPQEAAGAQDWLSFMLDHIDIQVRLAGSDYERELWQRVHEEVAALGGQLGRPALGAVDVTVRQIERDLQELRSYYDLAQSRSIATTALASFTAQAAIGLACVVTVLLFLLDLIMVRHWLVRPIRVLKASAEIIGRGQLDHRVPLAGRDELAQLARRIDAMAEGLAAHQAALLKARELSALGELCANVAHGLRNPLAALRAGMELAARRVDDAEDSRELFREVAQQVDRMDERITRLFQFSRPMELRPRPTSFAAVARAARAQALPLMKARGIELAIEDSTGDVDWSVDDEQLAQSLAELVTNAVHYSPPGSGVVLRGERVPSANGTGPSLWIEVIDQGAGMSAATQEKAFDLFFTSRPEGTGMGLALVRRFVERSGGGVSIESAPGRGTTVRLILPCRGPVSPSMNP